MSTSSKRNKARGSRAKPASSQWRKRKVRKWVAGSVDAMEAGDLGAAQDIAREGLRSNPDSVDLLMQLAMVLARQGDFAGARASAEALVRLQPHVGSHHIWVADVCEVGHDIPGAIDALERALAVDARSAAHWNRLGLLCLEAGRPERSAQCFREAFRRDPMTPGATLNLARAKRFERADDPDLGLMAGALSRGGGSPEHLSDVHFALAKAKEDLHDYAEAFAHLEEANDLVRAGLAGSNKSFDREAHALGIDRLIETFTPELIARLAGAGEAAPERIFIVGMPRSGTTLVEQILASHSTVFGAGELSVLDDISRGLRAYLGADENYPRCIRALDAKSARAAGIEYCTALEMHALGGAACTTDKMPSNFMHLGLAHVILPQSHAIHVTRDAMDTCLSIYTTQFGTGHAWAYSLEDIAFYYREYLRLMDHWNQVLPRPPFEVRYEDLVTDQEKWSRALLGECGLDWEPACLEFHRTERRVGSASEVQVRQPMYRSSLERWRRYEAELAPLRAALEAGA